MATNSANKYFLFNLPPEILASRRHGHFVCKLLQPLFAITMCNIILKIIWYTYVAKNGEL